MRLHVGMVCSKNLLRTVAREVFHNIHALASAVIALARVALRVFVGEHAAHRGHDCRGNEVFRSDQFNVAALTGELLLHGGADLVVKLGNKTDCIQHLHIPFSVIICKILCSAGLTSRNRYRYYT